MKKKTITKIEKNPSGKKLVSTQIINNYKILKNDINQPMYLSLKSIKTIMIIVKF